MRTFIIIIIFIFVIGLCNKKCALYNEEQIRIESTKVEKSIYIDKEKIKRKRKEFYESEIKKDTKFGRILRKSLEKEEWENILIDKEKIKKGYIQMLEEKVKKIPVSEYRTNLSIYKKLLKLDPNNIIYKNKINFYQTLIKNKKYDSEETIKRKRKEFYESEIKKDTKFGRMLRKSLEKEELENILDKFEKDSNNNIKISRNMNRVMIHLCLWNNMTLDQKEDFAKTLSIYYKRKRNRMYVTIYDLHSGKKLGCYDSWGLKVY